MGKADPHLLTQAEYARHRKERSLPGGSREAVRKAVDKKTISVFGEKGLIDPELADSQWLRNTRVRISPQARTASIPDLLAISAPVQPDAPGVAATPPQVTPPVSDNYAAARASQAVTDAETSRINLMKLKGEVLITADVARAGYEIGRELRDAMEASVNSLASELASVGSADACADGLRRHNRALQDLLSKLFREKIGAAAVSATA